jgi:EmrB/QacA subfamily drug resistance transporter
MPTAQRPGRVLAVVSLAVFMAGLDLFIVNVAMPDLARDFSGSSLGALSWVLNAYAIVFAALMVPAGRIADRVGRRRAFSGGIALFTVASALCGLAPSVPVLVAARGAQAVGAAFLMPASLALLLPAFPPARRPVAIGVWAAVGAVAAAAGPPLGGLLTEVSWRLVFLVNVPVGIAAVVLAGRVLTEARDETARRPDLFGTALLVGAITLLSLGLVQAPEWGWGDSRTVVALIAGPLGLVAFVVHCARSAAPVVELPMLRVRSYALANLAGLLFTAAFAATLLANVLFLTDVWGWSVLRAGLALAPGPICATITSVLGGRLAARFGQRWVAALGASLFALGAASCALRMEVEPAYASVLLPAWCVGGAGVGLTLSSLSSAAAAALPPARFATGTAVYTMFRQLGAVLGVAILVALLGTPAPADALAAFQHGWWFIAASAAAAALTALLLGPVTHHAPASAPAAAEAPVVV